MKRVHSAAAIVLVIVSIAAFLSGCASARQKYYDAKQYFFTDVARW